MNIQFNYRQLYYGSKLETRRFIGPLVKFSELILHPSTLAPSPTSRATKMVTNLKSFSLILRVDWTDLLRDVGKCIFIREERMGEVHILSVASGGR